MKLFLIGLPSCGKSTIGPQLAHGLSLPFIDLDTEIEKQENASVSTIFKEKGENYFRNVEQEQLTALCNSKLALVIATGGGTPCFFDNMKQINQTGTSIFLDVSSEEILMRLRLGHSIPFSVLPSKDKTLSIEHITKIRDQRIVFYQQAHLTFSGDQINKKSILEKLNS